MFVLDSVLKQYDVRTSCWHCSAERRKMLMSVREEGRINVRNGHKRGVFDRTRKVILLRKGISNVSTHELLGYEMMFLSPSFHLFNLFSLVSRDGKKDFTSHLTSHITSRSERGMTWRDWWQRRENDNTRWWWRKKTKKEKVNKINQSTHPVVPMMAC